MRSIGTTVSSAVIGVVLSHMTTDLGGVPLPSESGFQVGLLLGAAAAALAAGVALLIPQRAARAAEESIESPVEPVRA